MTINDPELNWFQMRLAEGGFTVERFRDELRIYRADGEFQYMLRLTPDEWARLAGIAGHVRTEEHSHVD